MNDRLTVYKALLRVQKSSGYSTLTLNTALDAECENPQFVSRLFYGVIERQMTLDYQLSLYSKKPLKSVRDELLCILRMGVYQLLYMDSIPANAAVNESVELAKSQGMSYAGGFINAVLHRVSEAGEVLPESGNLSQYLSIKFSCPLWLVKSFLNSYGEKKTCSLLESAIGKKQIFARVNSSLTTVSALVDRLKKEGVDCSPVQGFENSLTIACTGDIRKLNSFIDGLFYIEDLSSQICADALGALPGDRVLDICAAPGGKSFTIAQQAVSGEVVACDIHPGRVELIRSGAQRLGLKNVKPVINDAGVFNTELGLFDRVLCDVPCSGFGVIGRKPEIKYKPFDEVSELPALQLEILKNAFSYLKSGGILVYSTCTLLDRENQKVIKNFLKIAQNAHIAEQRVILPEEYGSDGFYYCILKKD